MSLKEAFFSRLAATENGGESFFLFFAFFRAFPAIESNRSLDARHRPAALVPTRMSTG